MHDTSCIVHHASCIMHQYWTQYWTRYWTQYWTPISIPISNPNIKPNIYPNIEPFIEPNIEPNIKRNIQPNNQINIETSYWTQYWADSNWEVGPIIACFNQGKHAPMYFTAVSELEDHIKRCFGFKDQIRMKKRIAKNEGENIVKKLEICWVKHLRAHSCQTFVKQLRDLLGCYILWIAINCKNSNSTTT